MAISIFDRHLLKFIYVLTQQKRLLNSSQASRLLGISDRTARRWLAFLKKQCFDYYLYPDCRSLGLRYFEVLLSDVKNEEICKVIPHSIYVMKGHDLSNYGGPCTILSFWIPQGFEKQFRQFWQEAKKTGLADAKIFEFDPPVEYYAQFHETLTKHGTIRLSKEQDFGFFSEALARNNSAHEFNPLSVPVIFEMFRENWSARLVWLNVKKKLGGAAEYYFNKPFLSDAAKIFLIREEMNTLQDSFNEYFSQVRISYAPMIYRRDRIAAAVYFDFEGDTVTLAESAAGKALLLNVRKSDRQQSFYFVTCARGFSEIISELASAGCSQIKTIIRDIGATDYYKKKRKFVKFPYWELFEPKTRTWKFEYEKYLAELKRLSG
ncbi:MAG: hypothetical protein HYT16_03315 [DPANN group archaeon]|nr:hypothetical protein [DPANN group archaeon]